MGEQDWLAERFEQSRTRLRGIAYRMLGSQNEAEDAVQEAWLRLQRSQDSTIDNLEGWLTTVTSRVCLDMLRARKARREEALETHLPEPIVQDDSDPEHNAIVADSVGLALLVVLETLKPNERLAFVLHDMFGLSFDEIAPIAGCSPVSARQLASRARKRIQGSAPIPDVPLSEQRAVVNAFLAAVRGGDLAALISVLDSEVVLRTDVGSVLEIHGASTVAAQAIRFSKLADTAQPVSVGGTAGILAWQSDGRPFSMMAFTVRKRKITHIDVVRDPERLHRLSRSLR